MHGTAPTVDVAVVGGGPAGAAASLCLAGAGLRVRLFERTHYDVPRVGEAVAPAVRTLLGRLGVEPDFERVGFPACHGISSAWGSERVGFFDFVLGAHGSGWHVDRAVFDAGLVAAAAARGVDVRTGASVRSCHEQRDGSWTVSFTSGGDLRTCRAAFVIFAAGRAALPRLSGRRIRDDRLVAVVRHIDATGSSISRTRTWVEAVPNGWWYAARLPGEVLVAAFFTDADLLPRSSGDPEGAWTFLLASAPRTAEALAAQAPHSLPKLVAAASWRREEVAGDRWVAVGDAAMAFDPLSGQGIYRALESGMLAAEAVRRSFEGEDRAMLEFAAWVVTTYETYRQQRRRMYSLEQRWPSSPFWSRRHQGSEPAGRRKRPAPAGATRALGDP